jgi:hypothetical protein
VGEWRGRTGVKTLEVVAQREGEIEGPKVWVWGVEEGFGGIE